jgi:hypothetical protein
MAGDVLPREALHIHQIQNPFRDRLCHNTQLFLYTAKPRCSNDMYKGNENAKNTLFFLSLFPSFPHFPPPSNMQAYKFNTHQT